MFTMIEDIPGRVNLIKTKISNAQDLPNNASSYILFTIPAFLLKYISAPKMQVPSLFVIPL